MGVMSPVEEFEYPVIKGLNPYAESIDASQPEFFKLFSGKVIGIGFQGDFRSIDRGKGRMNAFQNNFKLGPEKRKTQAEQIKAAQSLPLAVDFDATLELGNQQTGALVRAIAGNGLNRNSLADISQSLSLRPDETAAELLTIAKDRLRNNPEKEIRIACEEQQKIMNLRLEKLLGPKEETFG